MVPYEKSLYNRIFPAIAAKRRVTIPSYEEAVYNASMLLVNSHPSIGTPFKLPQSVKYIGGFHIDREIKPLPKVKSGAFYFESYLYQTSSKTSESVMTFESATK